MYLTRRALCPTMVNWSSEGWTLVGLTARTRYARVYSAGGETASGETATLVTGPSPTTRIQSIVGHKDQIGDRS